MIKKTTFMIQIVAFFAKIYKKLLKSEITS